MPCQRMVSVWPGVGTHTGSMASSGDALRQSGQVRCSFLACLPTRPAASTGKRDGYACEQRARVQTS